MKKLNMGLVLSGAAIVSVGAPISIGLYLTSPIGKKTKETPKDYEMDYEEITFFSNLDKTILRGWWIPSSNSSTKTVITAHGYTDERSQQNIKALSLVKKLSKEGYNVLMFDFRRFGKSDGKRTGVGFYEQHDLLGAIHYALEEKNQENIALLGWSMGAAAAFLAGEKSESVKVVIADSPFSALGDYLNEHLSIWSKLPRRPFTPMILFSLQKMLKIEISSVSPLLSAKNMENKAVFIIHSKSDKKIPYKNGVAIFEEISDKNKKELWLTEEAKHIESYINYKGEYEARVISFLKTYL